MPRLPRLPRPLAQPLARLPEPLAVLNQVGAAPVATVARDLPYGDHPNQRIDVYTPRGAPHATYPVMVFVHGGGWNTGDRRYYAFVGHSFAAAGYVTMVIGYRLAPAHPYPDYVTDTQAALNWAHDHAARYQGRPDQLMVLGHSAGAFNALAATTDARFLPAQPNVTTRAILGVIGLAGPYSYDFRQYDSRIAFPPDATPDAVMPDRHVARVPYPICLLTASRDGLVGDGNTHRLRDALTQVGNTVVTRAVPRSNHYTVVAALAPRLWWLNPARQCVLDFANAQVAKAERLQGHHGRIESEKVKK